MRVQTLIKMLSKCDPEGRVYLRRPAPSDDVSDRAVFGVITGGELVELAPGESDDWHYREPETIREAGYKANDVILEPV